MPNRSLDKRSTKHNFEVVAFSGVSGVRSALLYGAFGAGNLGDDLLLLSALRRYQRSVCVIGVGKPSFALKLPFLRYDDYTGIVSRLDRSTELVFAGGGQFWSIEHIINMYRLAARAKARGARVIIDSIGAQGAEHAPELVLDLCELSDFVSVRDLQSKTILGSIGVSMERINVSSDLVSRLEMPLRKSSPTDRFVVGITQGDVDFYFSETWRMHVMKIYNDVVAHFGDTVQFRFIPHVRHKTSIKDSCVLAGELIRCLSGNSIVPLVFPKNVERLLSYYRGLDLVIANQRYHSLVIASSMGVPSLNLYRSAASKYFAFGIENDIQSITLDDHSYNISPKLIDFIRAHAATS